MQRKTPSMELLDRLGYWENELDLEPCANPDPIKRLDHIIETSINDETILMERLSRVKAHVSELEEKHSMLKGIARQQEQTIQSLQARNKVLESRWTSLRRLLGIENRQEEGWE